MEKRTERVKAYFDRLAQDYDVSLPWDELTERVYDELTWSFIEPYLPSEGLVLDARGGTGKWAIPIAQRGLKVVLMDISTGMLEVARRKVKKRGLEDRISLIQGDVHALKFPDEHFDFALAEGMLEYCTDLERAFRELVRVLKPGCHLVVSVDSLYYVARAMLESDELEAVSELLRAKRYHDGEGVYCNALAPEDFKALAERHGLEVVVLIGKPILCPYLSEERKEAILKDPEKTQQLLEVELALCGKPSLVGTGSHLQLVARKGGDQDERSPRSG